MPRRIHASRAWICAPLFIHQLPLVPCGQPRFLGSRRKISTAELHAPFANKKVFRLSPAHIGHSAGSRRGAVSQSGRMYRSQTRAQHPTQIAQLCQQIQNFPVTFHCAKRSVSPRASPGSVFFVPGIRFFASSGLTRRASSPAAFHSIHKPIPTSGGFHRDRALHSAALPDRLATRVKVSKRPLDGRL